MFCRKVDEDKELLDGCHWTIFVENVLCVGASEHEEVAPSIHVNIGSMPFNEIFTSHVMPCASHTHDMSRLVSSRYSSLEAV